MFRHKKDVLLLNHARLNVSFCPCSVLPLSLTMDYNTFNSWEPHGEREKRVIAVTNAVNSALPFFDHHHLISFFFVFRIPHDTLINITIYHANLKHMSMLN